jgi:hypothetical protein
MERTLVNVLISTMEIQLTEIVSISLNAMVHLPSSGGLMTSFTFAAR